LGIGFVLHNKKWAEDRGQKTEDRIGNTEGGRWISGGPGFQVDRDLRPRFAARLVLAVWGVWAVGGRGGGGRQKTEERRWIWCVPGFALCWDFDVDDDFILLIRYWLFSIEGLLLV